MERFVACELEVYKFSRLCVSFDSIHTHQIVNSSTFFDSIMILVDTFMSFIGAIWRWFDSIDTYELSWDFTFISVPVDSVVCYGWMCWTTWPAGTENYSGFLAIKQLRTFLKGYKRKFSAQIALIIASKSNKTSPETRPEENW